MSIRFITGVLAVAATITAFSSAPAAADKDDLKRFVGAAATAYVLGTILNEAHKNGGVKFAHGYGYHGHGHNNGHWKKPGLPRHCLRLAGKHKQHYVLGGRCLWNSYRAAHLLPKRCLTTVWRKGHQRYVYSLSCLKHRGFRLAKH